MRPINHVLVILFIIAFALSNKQGADAADVNPSPNPLVRSLKVKTFESLSEMDKLPVKQIRSANLHPPVSVMRSEFVQVTSQNSASQSSDIQSANIQNPNIQSANIQNPNIQNPNIQGANNQIYPPKNAPMLNSPSQKRSVNQKPLPTTSKGSVTLKSSPYGDWITPKCKIDDPEKSKNCRGYYSIGIEGGKVLSDIVGFGVHGSKIYPNQQELGLAYQMNSLFLSKEKTEDALFFRYVALRFHQARLYYRHPSPWGNILVGTAAFSLRQTELGISGYKRLDYGDADFVINTRNMTANAEFGLNTRVNLTKHLEFGCEWLGISFPIASKSSEQSEYNGNVDPVLKDSSKKLNEVFLKPLPRFIVLNIAWKIPY